MRCKAAMCAASPAAPSRRLHWLPEARFRQPLRPAWLGHGPDLTPVAGHLRAGTLVELIAGKPVDVAAIWQYWRLNVQALARMTAAVQAIAHSAPLRR